MRVLPESRPRALTELIFNSLMAQEHIQRYGSKKLRKETSKPVTKANSKLDKEIQEWKVESTKGWGDVDQ